MSRAFAVLLPSLLLASSLALGSRRLEVQPIATSEALKELMRSEAPQGKVIHFWATWCSPCVRELPKFLGTAIELEKQGIKVLTVSVDKPEARAKVRSMLIQGGGEKAGTHFALSPGVDFSAAAELLDKKWDGALPATFLYDSHGTQRSKLIGQADPQALRAAAESLRTKPEGPTQGP